jgi:NTE family protein
MLCNRDGPMSGFLPPDALVLAAGGIVGEAWMTGVLAGIEDAHGVDFRRTEQLVGTSAGAIVAAVLAGGDRLRRPGDDAAGGTQPPSQPEPGDGLLRGGLRALGAAGWAVSAPLTTALWARGAGVGAAGRALVLARLPVGTRSLDRLRDAPELAHVRFDGRLRVVAVDRDSGGRVVFGAPGIFHPVSIAGRTYVDGGAWSLTNLDVARVGRDTHMLCLNVLGALPLGDMPAWLSALRVGGRASEAVERQIVRRRGATLRTIVPDAGSAQAIAGRLMDRERAGAALAAGYRQGLATA